MTHRDPFQPAPLKLETARGGGGSSPEETMALKGQYSYSNDDLGDSASEVSSVEGEHSHLKPSLEHDAQSLCSSQTTPLLLDALSIHSNDCSVECSSSADPDAALADKEVETKKTEETPTSFLIFRLNYLLVTLVIMLSDGLQGTHLYVLYEGYGFSVASLYCLGFITGAVTAPVTGALVDKFGRKKAALLYCFLEIGINMLEQYPFLTGLVISRMVGGITTNLLCSVFETWLDTEYRRRGFDPDKYEDLMRDSMVVKNMAAIASGYLAHGLAERLGPVGPFEGAVTCTVIAFVVVAVVWTENYGSAQEEERDNKSVTGYVKEAIAVFKNDSRILRVCIIQGLSLGALMIFIFLWSPTLANFAKSAPAGSMALDGQHEPAYGLIFGAFMAAGVVGGLCSCYVRKAVTVLLSPLKDAGEPDTVTIEGEGELRPMAVEFLAAVCYILSAFLFLVPCLFNDSDSSAFTYCIGAFVVFEVLLGVYSPCEGVIRSLYIPSDCRASIMTLPSIIVNVAVSIGVASTNVISLQIAFKAIAVLMVVAAVLQLSLISKRGWDSFFGRVDRLQKRALNPARSLMGAVNSAMGKPFKRSASMPVVPSAGWAKRISADQSEGTSPAAREMFVIADDAHLKDD